MNWRKYPHEKPEENQWILILDKDSWDIGMFRNNMLIGDTYEYEMTETYWTTFERLQLTLPKEELFNMALQLRETHVKIFPLIINDSDRD